MSPSIGRVCALAMLLVAPSAGAQELLTNGGFESGLAGWTRQVWAGSNGDLRAVGAGPGFSSGLAQVGPRTGASYALTDQSGPGAYSLLQSFTLSATPTAATLQFALSVTSYATPTAAGTDFNPMAGSARQFARVDLFAGALADGFSSAAPLQSFYTGPASAATGPAPWQSFSFDLTALLAAPGTYTLRFVEVDNQGFFNLGVDDVSLMATGVSTVPEPATVVLVGAGLAVAGLARRRRRA